ncbi:tricarballylate utilization 4Fe-4S protein TcuB [Maritimibacter sp. HL-12]|uniref:tricarballylate utilization 4Fe-4S protein TcuB n=1 Tax=Maritimibacter sp. HL-12 TaxID=1162418 RepID=UPI000A0F0C50|nr:tricarballylate utilization 4Fe-4S protein TcuB [Maritimibacter sp. HL-12]SMH28993.1 citrate/tricarballylate utilization protein [Maritimibacter sp. HL-12]
MPYDTKPVPPPDLHREAARQLQICNACRYCEGYCDVFPELFALPEVGSGDAVRLANICHNCRGCHYACQYAPPHEFALNLPGVLADLRQDSWERHARPAALARVFHRNGLAVAAALVAGFAALIGALTALRPESGTGFYAWLSHGAMVAIFLPAFLAPLAVLALGLRDFWREIGGGRPTLADWRRMLASVASLSNLSGGAGQGCNFEREERYSQARRHAHQATLWGFVMCFGATSAGTLMHYGFGLEAPYGLLSPPKLLGVPGGILLCLGTAALAWLRLQAERQLGARGVWGGEMAFVLLLFLVSASGLALYAASGTGAVPALLALHLGAVLTFFLLTPYTKMVHGFYRMAALLARRV